MSCMAWYACSQDPRIVFSSVPISLADVIARTACAPSTTRGFAAVTNLASSQATSVGINPLAGVSLTGMVFCIICPGTMRPSVYAPANEVNLSSAAAIYMATAPDAYRRTLARFVRSVTAVLIGTGHNQSALVLATRSRYQRLLASA